MLQWLILLTLFVHNSLALALYDDINGMCFTLKTVYIYRLITVNITDGYQSKTCEALNGTAWLWTSFFFFALTLHFEIALPVKSTRNELFFHVYYQGGKWLGLELFFSSMQMPGNLRTFIVIFLSSISQVHLNRTFSSISSASTPVSSCYGMFTSVSGELFSGLIEL
jgi:hypothetical protein